MDWRACTSRPGHDNIAASVGVSPDTVARAVAWLQERGFLGLVSPGTTPNVRPAGLYADTGNLAAVYVLSVPKRRSLTRSLAAGQERFADLSRSRRELDTAPRAHEPSRIKTEKAHAPRGLPVLPRNSPSPLHQCPQTRSEGREAALVLQDRSRELRRLSPEHVRHLARPFTLAGWTPADVLHALDHEPGGRQHRWSGEVRSPAAWAKWRLSLWLSRDGTPVSSRSQVLAESRRRDVAEQAARWAEHSRAAAAAVDPSPHAERIRATLRSREKERPKGSDYPDVRPHRTDVPPRRDH
jgi:hypothetical protein